MSHHEPAMDREYVISTLIGHIRDYMAQYKVSADDAIADYDMYIPEETWQSVRWYFDPANTEGFHA